MVSLFQSWDREHGTWRKIPREDAPRSRRRHVRENHGALDIRFSEQDLAELDLAFAPPDGPQPLEML